MHMSMPAIRLFPIPRNGHGPTPDRDPWQQLRQAIGARPSGIVQFPTRRSRLDQLRPGETLLILRKYGGLGDILISSMIFPMLAEQFPHVRVTYACPKSYHPLFEGTGLTLRPYEDVFSGENHYHRGTVRPELLTQYDLIEDISIGCHLWETVFGQYGGLTTPNGNGLKWRNRLDMWCRWFGVAVAQPRTNIIVREKEQAAARRLLAQTVGTGKPVCLLAPFASNRTKSYPWIVALSERLVSDGWSVALLHSSRVPVPVPTLSDLSFRQMGALCAVADLILSVDSAAFHWGGILRRPTLGIFNVNDGAVYAKYYPTARVVQICTTPCLNTRYGPGKGTCPKHTPEPLPVLSASAMATSRCYPRFSVNVIAEAARAFAEVRQP